LILLLPKLPADLEESTGNDLGRKKPTDLAIFVEASRFSTEIYWF